MTSGSNRLVDEALRMHEHPLITFKDGPAGRRARLVGGPDVWEVIGAVRSVRETDPALAGYEVLEVVVETSGVQMPFLRAARGIDCRAVAADALLRALSDLEIFEAALLEGGSS